MPSVFDFGKKPYATTSQQQQRFERAAKRQKLNKNPVSESKTSMLNVTFTVDNKHVDVREEEVDITAVEDDDTKEISRTRAVGVGCTISKPEQQYFCIERFMDKPQDFE